MGESYYDVLGVDPDASTSEITDAYRERVLETHPDRTDDPDAADRFGRVTTARDVLTDDVERARYDRLGHEAYRRLGSLSTESNARATGTGDGDGDESAGSSRASAATNSSNGAPNSRSSNGTATSDDRAGDTSSASQRGFGPTPGTSESADESHHTRHRRRRQRGAEFDGSRAHTWFGAGGNTQRRTRSSSEPAAGEADSSAANEHTAESIRFSVHEWDGEVDLSREYRRLDPPTAVTVGSIALLYPILVYSSLTPAFALPVNLVVMICTLALVGYLLTIPRVALATFGSWSVVASIAFWYEPALEPSSLLGGLALAAFWIPFGYALAVWWVLRP
ncbi:DnaJ domain-containing protein [Natronosalvus vescus]|uniref:DnaJ domain-containing protein n=1 Tax=Natronosalvus vescus TaxID=2953881 RepID=UPI002091E00E|nr:DnaJ domain-containing protein [Natronosalvus vescus]